MDDLISMKAAIDALEKEKPIPFINKDGSIDPFGAGQQNQWYRDGIAIMNLPTAPRWTPVTERLPKIDMSYPHHEDYLVQYDSGDMDVASWSNVNRFWTDHVTEPYWNCVQFAKVVAWMPLPEPWKGEGDD